MRLHRLIWLAMVLWTAQAAYGLTLTQASTVNVTAHQVTIWWRTDGSGSTEVHFGLNSSATAAGYTNHSVFSGMAGTLHSRTLSHLAPGTYFFRVRSDDGVAAAESSEGSFSVPVPDDITPLGTLVFDGTVNVAAVSGSTLFVGGAFTEVGTRRGGAVLVDTVDGRVSDDQPQIAGQVYAVIPDGVGGYFIGGDFGAVGGLPRTNIAHLLPDLGVDPTWSPTANTSVRALALSGSTLYLGGTFSLVNGSVRSNAAALNASTGALLAWNPNMNDAVYGLAVSGSSIYLTGDFTTVNGSVARNFGAVVDTAGTVQAFNPNLNGGGRAILVVGTTVYVGGVFTSAGNPSASRNRAAAFSTAGALLQWNPNVGGGVFALAALPGPGGAVYIGGTFTSANNGTPRFNAAAVDSATGALLAWNPNLNSSVFAIEVLGSTVFLGGAFTTANGGTTRRYGASVDSATGVLTGWNPHANAPIRALVLNASSIFIGGSFTAVNDGVTRNRAAAIDAASGALLSWDPNFNGEVRAATVSGTTVYLGGQFTTVNGSVSRNNAAAVDATVGVATGWNPDFNNRVNVMEVVGSAIVVGGSFTSVSGGVGRNRAAALDPMTATLNSWDPNFNNEVYTLSAGPRSVYLGGLFTDVNGGTLRSYAAEVDLVSGAVTSWDAALDNWVNAITLSGTTIYLAGNFTFANGMTTRNRAAAFDTDGTLLPWDPDLNREATAVSVAGRTTYVGGAFTSANGGVGRPRAIAVDSVSGNLTAWNPGFTNLSGPVQFLKVDCLNRRLIIGGSFYRVGVTSQAGLAILPVGSECDGVIVDAGVPDAGLVDAGAFDAGADDAGSVDAGAGDGGFSEIDAGAFVDAGLNEDAGSPPVDALAFISVPQSLAQCAVPYAAWATGAPALSQSGPFRFSLSGDVPPGLVVDETTGVITWTPTNQQAGTTRFTLVAQGDTGSAVQTFEVTVSCETSRLQVGCGCAAFEFNAGLLVLAGWALRRRRRAT